MSIKSALCFILIFILLLSVFTLSAFADSPASSFPILSTTETLLGSASSSTWYGYTISGEVYVVWVNTSDLDGPYFMSASPAQVHVRRDGTNYNSTLGYSSDYGVYASHPLALAINTSTLTTSLPVYNSKAEALQAFSEYINTPPEASSFQYSLPPGNVAYIPIASGQTSPIEYTLTTTYYMAFGNNDTSRINQVATVMSSLPSTTNNTAPSAPKIPWTNNGDVNLLGISANKIYQGTIPTSYGGQFLVVVNPMTMPSQGGLIGGDTYTNGSINITVSAVSGTPHVYPMSESLTIVPGDGIGSESTYGDSGYTYAVDPETGEIVWTDPDGGNSAPVAGGNNPMPTPNTIFDWLRNISQQLSDFLRGPVQAVQVVVSAIRDFMGSFTQLYQWLPSPVYSLITSALMIALTIGVIKIFV